ncbi:MAG: DUF3352 domain-containing protein, partial [Actinomycetota bacterium]|nr:DUF3352 domain-containing protein [Actinomycetota bacterium]
VYAASLLSGGGTQPEDVLPAAAIGFVKVDLDPAAGQKLAAYRLSTAFPDSGVEAEADVADELVRRLFAEQDEVDYDADLRPWLGKRLGLAVLPPRSGSDEPVVVAAVQVTDRDEAQQGLRHLAAADDGDELHWAFARDDDYVLVSDDQAVVDDAAAATAHLAGRAEFERSVEELGGDQVALGWVDLAGVWDAVPEQDRREASGSLGDVDPQGVVVVGAHLEDDGVEVTGRSTGVSLGSSPELRALLDNALVRARPAGSIADLPGDSLAAVSVTGLGDGLAQLYDVVADDLGQDVEGLQPVLEGFGLRLPDDLRAVLGTELAAGVGGQLADAPRVSVRVQSSDGARAVELLQRATADVPGSEGWAISAGEGGYTVDTAPSAGGTAGRLGDSALFRRTVPDAPGSSITWYVDVRESVAQDERTGESDLTERQRRNLAPVRAVGYTATVDEGGSAAFRFRVVVGEVE